MSLRSVWTRPFDSPLHFRLRGGCLLACMELVAAYRQLSKIKTLIYRGMVTIGTRERRTKISYPNCLWYLMIMTDACSAINCYSRPLVTEEMLLRRCTMQHTATFMIWVLQNKEISLFQYSSSWMSINKCYLTKRWNRWTLEDLRARPPPRIFFLQWRAGSGNMYPT